MNLPEDLNSFIVDIKQLHFKYVKEQTVPDNVFYTKIDHNEEEISAICGYFKKEYGDKLESQTIVQRLEEIIKNFEDLNEIDLKLLIYDFLKEFHNRNSGLKEQNYLPHLLDIHFRQLLKTIPTSTKTAFENLAKISLPYVKLETVIHQLRKGIIPSKESLKQVCECILYRRISREDCHQIIFNKFGNFNYNFEKFDLIPLDEHSGFLGEHFELEITIKYEDMIKILNFFVKFVTTGTGPFDMMTLCGFKKEELIYLKMMPQLKKLGVTNLAEFAPQCFLLRENEFIVLENLTPLGFSCLRRSASANYDWMVKAIEHLSKFHACFFILESNIMQESNKKASIGDLYNEYLKELIYEKNGILGFESGENVISPYFIEASAELWTEMSVDEFKKKLVMATEATFEDVKKSDKYHNVICHGDLHGKNILMNKLEECFFIDFQLTRYCPPAMDVLFLIYYNTSRDLRQKHMKEMTEIYFKFLKHYLSLYNMDINEFYTWEEFSESINYYKSSAIIMVLLYLQVYMYPPESVREYDNSSEKIAKYYHEERCKSYSEKIGNLIIDLYDIHKNSGNV